MGGVLHPAHLNLLPEPPAEGRAAAEVAIAVGNEERMTVEPVAIGALLALVFPFLQKPVRHRIGVDRQEEARREGARARGRRSVGPLRALPWVTSSTVLSKPASFNCCSISLASRRLKSYSYKPRALLAPGASAV